MASMKTCSIKASMLGAASEAGTVSELGIDWPIVVHSLKRKQTEHMSK